MAHKSSFILSVNAGSSSLKVSLFRRAENPEPGVLALVLSSAFSNISSAPAEFSFQLGESSKIDKNGMKAKVDGINDHSSAFAHVLAHMKDGASVDREAIRYVCHRVVHGGDYLEPAVISEKSFHHIEKLTELAPLHNGAALSVISASLQHLPSAVAIAYFDTTFHRSIPPHISSYAIDPTIAKTRGLKKYGFHGLSYAYILRSVASYLQKPETETSIIALHLGSGASVCAIKSGRSLDTSMGLTPVEGLPGATRSGAVDPSLIFHYTNSAGRITHEHKHAVDVSVTKAEEILNKKSGWNVLAGTTDFGEVVDGRESDTDKALVFDLFVDRILNYVGGYFVKLSGEVDALVFAGGIGEKSAPLRAAILSHCACLGFPFDEDRNRAASQIGDKDDVVVMDIDGRKEKECGKRVLVCKTDEQAEMARHCAIRR